MDRQINQNKVGIITFHNAHNYGAVLQAYALYKRIKELGYQVDFIQNDNDYIGKKYRLFPSHDNQSVKEVVKGGLAILLDFKRKFNRHTEFERFIHKYLPVNILGSNTCCYHSIVLGSDQIWNFDLINGVNSFYFGSHELLNTSNTISYAASMGKKMSNNSFDEKFRKQLENVKHIGVREEKLGEMIHNNFSLESTPNLDPTLLLDKESWTELIDDSLNNKESYILVYEVEKHKDTNNLVEYLEKKLSIKVKVISSQTHRKVPQDFITAASPNDFLSLFKNAKFVVTTSFHGTVFSIINNVPFFTMKFNTGLDHRSAGLLEKLSLSDRHIDYIGDNLLLDVDFENANKRLIELRELSVQYLKSSLEFN